MVTIALTCNSFFQDTINHPGHKGQQIRHRNGLRLSQNFLRTYVLPVFVNMKIGMLFGIAFLKY